MIAVNLFFKLDNLNGDFKTIFIKNKEDKINKSFIRRKMKERISENINESNDSDNENNNKNFCRKDENNNKNSKNENSLPISSKERNLLKLSSKMLKGFLNNQKKLTLNSCDSRIFGNSIQTLEVDERKTKFIIYLNSWYRKLWDSLIFFIIIYTSIITPIYLSFWEESILLKSIELLIEIIFVIDLFINFFTTYIDEEEAIVTDLRQISLNYFFTWFLFDLFITIPFELLSFGLPNDFSFIFSKEKFIMKITFFKWFKIIRLARLYKTQTNGRFFSDIVLNKNNLLNRIFKFLITFFIVSHIASCYFIYIGFTSINNNNWICTAGLSYSDYIDIYISSLYYIQVTVYSIGYGDITPVNTLERIYSSLFMIIGSILYSFAISSISTIYAENANKGLKYKNQKNLLKEIEEEHEIKPYLQEKLKQAIHELNFNRDKERYKFLESLPSNLRRELSFIMYRTTINNHKFFNNQKHEFALHALQYFSYRRIRKEDVLFSVGEKLQEMYLILKGRLGLFLEKELNNMEIWEINKNDYFGDLFLQLNYHSPYELKCKSKTAEILVLKKNDFQKLKRIFNDNLINILENSLKELRKIEVRKILMKHLLKFCGTSELVRKKIKQLKMLCLNQELIRYFDARKQIKNNHKFVFSENIKETIEFLSALDDPHFINFGEKDPKFISKESYINNCFLEENEEIDLKNEFLNKKSLIINNQSIKDPYPNTENEKKNENIELDRDLKSYRNSQTFTIKNDVSDSIMKKLASEKVVNERNDLLQNSKISKYKTIKTFRRRKGLNSNYTFYYNKLLENVDGLSEIHDKSLKEKMLNRNTLKVMNSSQSIKKFSIDVFKNPIDLFNKKINQKKERKKLNRSSSNFKREKLVIEKIDNFSINSILNSNLLKEKFEPRVFKNLVDISVENFCFANKLYLASTGKTNKFMNINGTICRRTEKKTIINDKRNVRTQKKSIKKTLKENISVELKLDKIIDIISEYKKVSYEIKNKEEQKEEMKSLPLI
jgi:hypothetical protein